MWRVLSGLTLVSLLACAGAGEDGKKKGGGAGDDPTEVDPYSVDADGDGLSDGEEADLGLDPNLADSDGDGWEDQVEVDGNTDGADADDHPYTGGWTIDACRSDLDGQGFAEGDVVEDFELMDQFGEMVSAHDFCDRVIFVVFAAFW